MPCKHMRPFMENALIMVTLVRLIGKKYPILISLVTVRLAKTLVMPGYRKEGRKGLEQGLPFFGSAAKQ